MRHKNLRKQDKEFLSKFSKVLRQNTWMQVSLVVDYVKENRLSIRQVCEFLNWKIGDRKEVPNDGCAQLVRIRKKGDTYLMFETTYKYSASTFEDHAKYAKSYKESCANIRHWLGLDEKNG